MIKKYYVRAKRFHECRKFSANLTAENFENMKIHLTAVGGAVMHQLAICLKEKGYEITGSDDQIYNPARQNLHEAGILPKQEGFYTDNITKDLDAVIAGMHAKQGNPEIKEALRLNIPIYSFPEFIYEQSKNKKRVIIAGSHGKTTTTAMIMHVLRKLGKDFDYLVGAALDGFERSVKLTDNAEIILLEGDEYLASALKPVSKFLFYKPHITMITGIAWDHINVFPTLESYHATFVELLKSIEKGNAIIYFGEDDVLSSIVRKNGNEKLCIPYYTPIYEVKNGQVEISLPNTKKQVVSIFGKHNLQNLTGAFQVCLQLGISAEEFLDAIADFTGAAKRLEKIFDDGNNIIYRDFAHSPSKVKATVEAVAELHYNKRIIAFFELNTYSSLDKNFMEEYKNTLNPANEVFIYLSDKAMQIKQRKPIPENTIKDGFNNHGISILRSKDAIQTVIQNLDKNNCVLLLMSSGQFDGLDLEWVKKKI